MMRSSPFARTAVRVRETLRRFAGDDGGSVIVFVCVAAVVLLGAGALAVDGGMLYSARREAQRAADAAALAGGSAFVDFGGPTAATLAETRARDYAKKNRIRGVLITDPEVTVTLAPESAMVTVAVRRSGVATSFLGMLGRPTVPISAKASARAAVADVTRCVKPFGPADAWSDADDDWNQNRVQDGGEFWVFGDNPGDRYRVSTGRSGAIPPETGYGSSFRGSSLDAGRRLQLNAHANQSGGAGEYYTWDMPVDPTMVARPGCAAGGGTGATNVRANICNCNKSNIKAGDPYPVNGGNMVGPIHQGILDLLSLDPNAYWDPVTNTVMGSNTTPWWNSPRVVTLPLYAPTAPPGANIRFTKFMMVFVEGQPNQQDPISVRFMHVVGGLRLVN